MLTCTHDNYDDFRCLTTSPSLDHHYRAPFYRKHFKQTNKQMLNLQHLPQVRCSTRDDMMFARVSPTKKERKKRWLFLYGNDEAGGVGLYTHSYVWRWCINGWYEWWWYGCFEVWPHMSQMCLSWTTHPIRVRTTYRSNRRPYLLAI